MRLGEDTRLRDASESGGTDGLVDISVVERAGMRTLDKDQRVSYELETDRRGKASAVNLQSALRAGRSPRALNI